MKETLKYIEVLNWGYSGFAPMTLGQNFEKSLQQVQERLALLDGLDYGALFVEATNPNGKANLEKYKKTDADFEYQLHFMRDRQTLLDAIPTMYKCLKDGADKFRADGLWSDEQWREYRFALSEIERGFEERLKQFSTAYEILTTELAQPSFLQIDKIVNAFDRAVESGYMTKQNGKYRWIKDKGTLLCALIGTLLLGDCVGIDGDYRTKGGAETFPASDIENYFKLKDISKKRYQLNGKKPPIGFEKMIKLLIEQP